MIFDLKPPWIEESIHWQMAGETQFQQEETSEGLSSFMNADSTIAAFAFDHHALL